MAFTACFGVVIVCPDEWLCPDKWPRMARFKFEHSKINFCLTSTWHVHRVPFNARGMEVVPVPAPDQNSPRLTVPSLLTMGPTC